MAGVHLAVGVGIRVGEDDAVGGIDEGWFGRSILNGPMRAAVPLASRNFEVLRTSLR